MSERTGEQVKKQIAMLHSEQRARRASGVGFGGVHALYFLFFCGGRNVWSGPKGPPQQGHNAIKHSEMKCLIGGDKGRRGERGK